jgi:polyisoprenyl-phosphate glycosyltransferase
MLESQVCQEDTELRQRPALIDIVVPVHNEARNVEALLEACDVVTASIANASFRFVFVNDGSRDGTLALLRSIASKRNDVLAIDLSRNFGKEIALSAGLDYADGDAVIFMDADLQHPPALLPRFIEEWRKGTDVVAGVRKTTGKKSLFRKVMSGLYHRALVSTSDHEVISGSTDFRIIDRCVADALREIGERKRMFRGLIDWLGFTKVLVEFEAPARFDGEPNYTTLKLAKLALDGILSHSEIPLRLVMFSGGFTTSVSALGLLWMTLAEHIFGIEWHYTPLAKAVVFNTALVGVVLLALSILALYLAKIQSEVSHRPLYAVRRILGARAETARVGPAQGSLGGRS